MEKLVYAGEHITYIKTAEEELDLVLNGSMREKWEYFLNYNLQNEEAEYLFARSSNFKLLEMYDTFYHGHWRPESKKILCQHPYFKKRFEEISDEEIKQRFLAWNRHQLYVATTSFESERAYAEHMDRLFCAGGQMFPKLSFEEQNELLNSRYLPDIRDYSRCREWEGTNRLKFIRLGDLYALFLYLQLFRFESAEEELALLQLGYGPLMWKYATEHYLTEPACAAIFLSDNRPLWDRVYWLNYEFNKIEKDRKVRWKLEADLTRSYSCMFNPVII